MAGKPLAELPYHHHAFLPLRILESWMTLPTNWQVFHLTWGKGLACSIQLLCFCGQSSLLQDSCISVWPLYTLPAKASNINLKNAFNKSKQQHLPSFLYSFICEREANRKEIEREEIKEITSSTSMSISSHFNALTITSNFTWWALLGSFCFWMM